MRAINGSIPTVNNGGVAELTHKMLTLVAAPKAHEAETVTGTITVTFDLDAAGRTRQRTRVETVQVAWPNGRIDTQTVTSRKRGLKAALQVERSTG